MIERDEIEGRGGGGGKNKGAPKGGGRSTKHPRPKVNEKPIKRAIGDIKKLGRKIQKGT